jgi:hypothetical protein
LVLLLGGRGTAGGVQRVVYGISILNLRPTLGRKGNTCGNGSNKKRQTVCLACVTGRASTCLYSYHSTSTRKALPSPAKEKKKRMNLRVNTITQDRGPVLCRRSRCGPYYCRQSMRAFDHRQISNGKVSDTKVLTSFFGVQTKIKNM